MLIYGLLYKTVFGLRIYACGNNSDAATVRGISVNGYRFISILLTGVFCGIAGAFLSLRLGSYVPDITAGRGWIALVAIFLGRKKPLGVAAACFFFALTESFAVRMQDWVDAPGVGTLIWAIPYAVTLAAVVIYRIIQDRVKRS